jgi:hypothetical protein
MTIRGSSYLVACLSALGLVVATASCGPKAPTHDGYRSSKPWKKAKKVKFDEDNESAQDGTLSYPKQRRARWYVVDLPGDGELTVKMEITPLGSTRQNVAVGFEVLDGGFNVVTRKYADPEPGEAAPTSRKKKEEKSADDGDDDDWGDDDDDWDDDDDVEEEEEEIEGELEWEQTLYELRKGRYFVHLYTMGRMDEVDYSMRLKYASGQAARISNFPNNVPFYEPLPVVPAFDDAPAVDCKTCNCRRDDRCKEECGKCNRRTTSRFSCSRCSCSSSTCKRRCKSKCGGDDGGDDGPAPDAVSARVIRFVAAGGGTKVVMNRGSSHGVEVGWKGRIVNSKGKSIEGGSFTVKKVTSSTSEGQVGASPDTVRAAGRARLSKP